MNDEATQPRHTLHTCLGGVGRSVHSKQKKTVRRHDKAARRRSDILILPDILTKNESEIIYILLYTVLYTLLL